MLAGLYRGADEYLRASKALSRDFELRAADAQLHGARRVDQPLLVRAAEGRACTLAACVSCRDWKDVWVLGCRARRGGCPRPTGCPTYRSERRSG